MNEYLSADDIKYKIFKSAQEPIENRPPEMPSDIKNETPMPEMPSDPAAAQQPEMPMPMAGGQQPQPDMQAPTPSSQEQITTLRNTLVELIGGSELD